MEFRHLRYFVEVAEELHFRRAAERLHIAQAALSEQIAKLEEELGVELIARTKRSVALTEAGNVFLDEARAMLERRDQACIRALRAGAGKFGTVRAGFVGPATYTVLHSVVRAYRGSYPDVTLKLFERTTNQQLDLILAGALDVGLVRLPLHCEQIRYEHLLSEPVIAVLPRDHPLAGSRAIRPADLASEAFIMVPRELEPAVFDQYVGICAAAQFSPKIVQEAEQIHTIVELVAAGLGIALAPASLATLQRPDVAYRPLAASARTSVQTGIAWHRDRASAIVDTFVRTAIEAVREASAARPARDEAMTGKPPEGLG